MLAASYCMRARNARLRCNGYGMALINWLQRDFNVCDCSTITTSMAVQSPHGRPEVSHMSHMKQA